METGRMSKGIELTYGAAAVDAVKRWESAVLSACDAWKDVERFCAAAGLDPVDEAFDGSRIEYAHIMFELDGSVRMSVMFDGDDESKCMAGFNSRHELLPGMQGASSSKDGTRAMRFLAREIIRMSNGAESDGWADGLRPEGAVLARVETAVVNSPSHASGSVGGAR